MTETDIERLAGEMRQESRQRRSREFDGAPLLLPPPSEPMAVARRFVEMHCMYEGVQTMRCWGGSWWTWRTTRWGEVDERSVRTLLYLFTENAFYFDNGGMPRAWAPTRRRIGDLLEALAAVTLVPQDFAQPCWLDNRASGPIVAVENGLLDIGSRALRPHTPLYFSATSVPFAYDPAAPTPQHFLDFLAELWPQEPEATDALGEWFGYIISGRTDLQKMSLMVGPTRGGKGVLARLLTALIGAPNVCGPTLSSLAGEFGLSPLLGKVLAIISDVRFVGKQNVVVERLLSISGEDLLNINRKYREQINVRLTTRMHLLSNEMPRLTDASGAIIGRFIVFILTRSWLGREDHALEERLKGELPGILNWSLDGLARLNRNDGRFTCVLGAEEAVSAMRDLASPAVAFVRECCVLNTQSQTPVKELYAAFKRWAVESEYPKKDRAEFGRDLHAAFPSVKKKRPRKGKARAAVYTGISLRSGEDGEDDEQCEKPFL